MESRSHGFGLYAGITIETSGGCGEVTSKRPLSDGFCLNATRAILGQYTQGGGSPMAYDSNFLWGAAISAHQVEGAFEGGENGDWYRFEHTPGNVLNGDT